jgi:hypothetical protein
MDECHIPESSPEIVTFDRLGLPGFCNEGEPGPILFSRPIFAP